MTKREDKQPVPREPWGGTCEVVGGCNDPQYCSRVKDCWVHEWATGRK